MGWIPLRVDADVFVLEDQMARMGWVLQSISASLLY